MSEVDDAAVLAVGDDLEADALLERDRLSDEAILGVAKGFRRESAFVEIAAGHQQGRRPEEAADVLGPERPHGAGSYRIYSAPCGRAACSRSTSRRRPPRRWSRSRKSARSPAAGSAGHATPAAPGTSRPGRHPAGGAARPRLMSGLRHRGGLRAQILTGALIRVGDVVRPA